MCVVSFVGDFYEKKWEPYQPYTIITYPVEFPQEEFNQLKKEVQDMKELIKRAKVYDKVNNEPNCEIDEKMEFLQKVAKLVGEDFEVVKKPKTPEFKVDTVDPPY